MSALSAAFALAVCFFALSNAAANWHEHADGWERRVFNNGCLFVVGAWLLVGVMR